jgi:hypothetical protein
VGVNCHKEFLEGMSREQDALARRSMTYITAARLQSEAPPVHRIAVGRQDVQIQDSAPRQVPFERNCERLDRRSRLGGDEDLVRAQQIRTGEQPREVQPSGVESGQASPHQCLQPRTIFVRAGEIRADDHDRAGSRLSGQAAGRQNLLVPRIARGKILTP